MARAVAALAPGSFGAQLDDGEWAALRVLGRTVRFPPATALMHEGEPGDRVAILVSGRVKVVRVGDDGRERLLSIRDPGDLIGELSFLDGEPRVGTVVALEPVEALVLPATAFRAHLERTPRLAVVLLQALSHRFRETTLKRSQFGALDTVGRVAARVVELAERYGDVDGDRITVGLPLTQEELASWTAASPAGVAKALQTLRELGWIQTRRRQIVVCNLGALRQRAG